MTEDYIDSLVADASRADPNAGQQAAKQSVAAAHDAIANKKPALASSPTNTLVLSVDVRMDKNSTALGLGSATFCFPAGTFCLSRECQTEPIIWQLVTFVYSHTVQGIMPVLFARRWPCCVYCWQGSAASSGGARCERPRANLHLAFTVPSAIWP